MPQLKLQRLSAWHLTYAVNMALAAAITYGVMVFVIPLLVNRPADPVGILWAVISTVFVFRDAQLLMSRKKVGEEMFENGSMSEAGAPVGGARSIAPVATIASLIAACLSACPRQEKR